MTFDDAKMGLIKALVYSVQFDNDPCDDLVIDRIIEKVVKTNTMGAMSEVFHESIKAALSSDEKLSDIIPQDHPEWVIRTYLEKLEEHLNPDHS